MFGPVLATFCAVFVLAVLAVITCRAVLDVHTAEQMRIEAVAGLLREPVRSAQLRREAFL